MLNLKNIKVYAIVCLDDGKYVLMTRQLYSSYDQALVRASRAAKSRLPIVVEITLDELNNLRLPDTY